VENFTSGIISCFSNGRGFRLTANDILFKSELSSVAAKFKEEEMIRVSFVVESRLKNRIIYTCINGIASGAIQYVDNDSFEQVPPVGITLGHPDCTLDVYNIRSYSTDLNSYQILNNYIADTALVAKKLALYDSNQIHDSTGEIVYNLLVNQLPCMTITGELPTFKGDKKTVSMTFENRQNPERSFTAGNVQIDVQGTSSQFYPRKNFKHKFKSGLTLTETGERVTKYALNDSAIPVDTFCEKADFAESSGTHNTGMAKYIDSVLRDLNYLTPPQKDNAMVRTTVDGYPIAIFHKTNDNSPAEFTGKYNFNNDKSTQETFGFDGADECWEFLNNTADRCLFKSADFSGTAWLDDFEGRYPDGYTDATNLSALAGWVVSCKDNPARFKSEASAHFNVNNLLSYYLLSELFGMVDQRAKNMMLASWGNEGSGAYKWYFIFYDNDTCLGINNEGANVFPFNIEDHDTLGDGHVWNGWDSELWKLVKASFTAELAVMYRNMRQTGALSYSGAIRILNDEQAFKWSEVVYNLDGQYKYVQPLIESGQATYLYALQGSRTGHRIWWLKNRFFYMDSKYNASDFLNDFITMRIYTPATWQGVEPDADFDLTLYKDSYVRVKYGSYVLEQRARAEETVHIAAPAIQFNDTETIIYGISTVKGIGALSALYPGTVDIANATTLTELIIGSAVEGYKNENLSHVSAGNNKMLRMVDIQNCPNYTEPLDLSGCENLETLKALGSSISAVKLPAAGIVSLMELPATIANLTVKNQQSLTSDNLILTGINNISTLVLENMNSLDQLGLIRGLLAVEPLKLNRIRLIGVDMEDNDLSVLMKLATVGGLDEQDNPLPRAVVTGKFHAGAAFETDINNCRGWFPELEITVAVVEEDPTTTFEFLSSQLQPLTNSSFTANYAYQKISETRYSVKAPTNAVINFTYRAENHMSITDSYIATTATTRRFTAVYIPLRTLFIRNYLNGNPVEGVTVEVEGDDTEYMTDVDGKAYIRRAGAIRGKAYNNDFGSVNFDFAESLLDRQNDFYIYPFVNLTLTVRDLIFGKRLQGAVITCNGVTVTMDSKGIAIFRLSNGSYPYTLKYGDKETEGTFNIGAYDATMELRADLPLYTFKPAENGDIQIFVNASNNQSVSLTIKRTSNLPFYIDWGDGSDLTPSTGDINTYGSYSHTYNTPDVDWDCRLISVKDCGDIDYLQYSAYQYGMLAFWSVGDSKLNGLSFSNYYSLKAVGSDLFKNDVQRDGIAGRFQSCTDLREVTAGLFDGLISVQSAASVFKNCTKLTSVDKDLFRGIPNVVNFSEVFSGCTALTAVPADLFKYNTKATNFASAFYNFRGTTVPEDLFKYNTEALNFSSTFQGSSMTSVPAGLFRNCTKALNFTACFQETTGLTTVPEDLFRYNTEATTFQNCFRKSKIVSVGNLFYHNSKAKTFSNLFESSASLESVGSDLFKNCIDAENFSYAFYMTKLNEIPAGLFDACVDATDFNYCFHRTKIEEIPAGLFDNCLKIASLGHCFNYCGLKSIPENLLKNPPLLKTVYNCFEYNPQLSALPDSLFPDVMEEGFNNFKDCTSLASISDTLYANCPNLKKLNAEFSGATVSSIPENLFSQNSEITELGSMFSGAKITSIPALLFDNLPSLKHVDSLFSYCTNLTTVPVDLFDKNPLLEYASSLFYNCSKLESVNGNLFSNCPDLKGLDNMFYGSGLKTLPAALLSHSSAIRGINYLFTNSKLVSVPGNFTIANISQNVSINCLFYNCPLLETADIHESWSRLGDQWFCYCPSMRWVKVRSTAPPQMGYYVFGSSENPQFPIYVPDEAINDYKAATGWIDYANRIFPLSQATE
jgi:hypothetical protein